MGAGRGRGDENHMAAMALRPITAPKKSVSAMIPRNEMTVPAMASPRGALNNPITEKMVPSNHRMKPRTGVQQSTSESRARMNPAVPMPFFFTGGWLMMICCGG